MKEAFLQALDREIVARKDYLNGLPVSTIYFGGGTPSLLTPAELKAILDRIKTLFSVATDSEITLEANPDTLSPDYLASIKELGINRLSIGIQSFFDEDLRYLNRLHDSQHAMLCLGWTRDAGFDNITLDLIYGLPTSNAERWNRNLDIFFQTGIPHLSAYALTVEPSTVLARQIQAGKILPVDEDDAVRDYEILCRRAKENGFLHYEISNFCKPQHHSRHNCSYWNRTPYIGLGPAAHSFDGGSRQWNVSNLTRYVSLAGVSDDVFEKETLTPEQRYDEYVMTALRTMWGCDLKFMARELGERFSDFCQLKAKPLVEEGKMTQTREFLYLDDTQMLFADGLAEALFWEA